MIRALSGRASSLALAVALALAFAGCGGAADMSPPAQPIGVIPHAAVTLWVKPQPLLDGLDALHARMGGELGPVSEAWTRFEQDLSDSMAGVLPSRSTQPTLLAEWGVDAAQPMRVSIAAPEALLMAKALVQQLTAHTPQLPAVLVHGRVEFGITDRDRVMEALGVVTARIGLDKHRIGRGQRPDWIGAESLPPDVRWLGRDAQTGTWAVLRVREGRGALDVLMPPKAGLISALVAGLSRSATARPTFDAPIALQVRPAEMALLETATAAFMGLRYGQTQIGEAMADVLTACIGRWRESAEHAASIDTTLHLTDGRPALNAVAHLTPLGEAAWARAERPAPREVWGLAAWRMGWNSDSFGQVNPEWLKDTTQCVGGRFWTAGPAALPILPRVLPAFSMPMPPMLASFGWARIDGAAAAIVDAASMAGEATPVIAGVLHGFGGLPPAPLGPDAVKVERDGETLWRAIDAPVEIGHRPGQLRVGLGPDALRPVEVSAAPLAFEAVVDASALADRLSKAGQAGAEVRALAAVGRRFGQLRATVQRTNAQVRLQVHFKP